MSAKLASFLAQIPRDILTFGKRWKTVIKVSDSWTTAETAEQVCIIRSVSACRASVPVCVEDAWYVCCLNGRILERYHLYNKLLHRLISVFFEIWPEIFDREERFIFCFKNIIHKDFWCTKIDHYAILVYQNKEKKRINTYKKIMPTTAVCGWRWWTTIRMQFENGTDYSFNKLPEFSAICFFLALQSMRDVMHIECTVKYCEIVIQ